MVRRRRFLRGYAGGKEIFEWEFKKSVWTEWIGFSDVVHVAHTLILCGGGGGVKATGEGGPMQANRSAQIR